MILENNAKRELLVGQYQRDAHGCTWCYQRRVKGPEEYYVYWDNENKSRDIDYLLNHTVWTICHECFEFNDHSGRSFIPIQKKLTIIGG